MVFREVISQQLWLAIGLVTLASILLSLGRRALGLGGGPWGAGGLPVWGFENNCTRKISHKSSQEIVVIKGCFSGLEAVSSSPCCWERGCRARFAGAALRAEGFVSYGLSINFYILAQKDLGAAKTSAYYSIAPLPGGGLQPGAAGEAARAPVLPGPGRDGP